MDDNKLKTSPYLYLFKSKDFGFLAYNGINNAFMKINEELYKLLKESINQPNLLNHLDKSTFDTLVKKNVICNNKTINFLKTQKRFLHTLDTFHHNFLSLTIAPTTACNFSCPYCYEHGIAPKSMNNDVLKKTIDFIRERSSLTNNNISITWYGGEPLLAIDSILLIYENLKDSKINILDSSMITNGYYLNDSNIENLKRLDIKTIQITLDGANPSSHNRRRNNNNIGSWEVILKNIDNLLTKNYNIDILIRCNLDKKNVNEYYTLQKYLNKRWNNHKNIHIYSAPLKDYETCSGSECSYMTDQEAELFKINELIKDDKLPYFKYNYRGCTATQLNGFVIGPEGELYKCWNDMGRKEKVVDTVFSDGNLKQEVLFNYLMNNTIFDDPECEQCKLFFVCNGGCQWQRIKDKNLGKKSTCHIAKNNFENYLEQYYKLKSEQC